MFVWPEEFHFDELQECVLFKPSQINLTPEIIGEFATLRI